MFLPQSIGQLLALPNQPQLVRDEVIAFDSCLMSLIHDASDVTIARLGCLRLISLRPITSEIYYYIVLYGHLDILKYLCKVKGEIITDGQPWYKDIYAAAIRQGDPEILEYIHKNRNAWGSNTCTTAVQYNNLGALRYLHENGCPWDRYTYEEAIRKGHLDALKYLDQNGCPRYKNACRDAISRNHLDILKYLWDNGSRVSLEYCLRIAHRWSRTDIIEWLESL